MKPMRLYIDTSVIGGCFDDEFAEYSLRLIDAARAGRIVLLMSAVVIRELAEAPMGVRALLKSLPAGAVEETPLTSEILALRDAYIAAKVIGSRWSDDAAHVAAATVARADAIVSWNFQHIVRLDRMKGYNRVNLLNGYGVLTIVSPLEVRADAADKD
ncbi:MAG: hypothetical protein HY922_00160 [Elusimicrobia bacterium]|nr:hypothetical protein [Elusimicrobiota bacterium]